MIGELDGVVDSIVELSPLHLSFPTFFLSLNLITNDHVLNVLIMLILVSVFSIVLSFLYTTTSESSYSGKMQWVALLLSVVYANHVLQDLNVINLVLINLLINDYNLYNEKSLKEFKYLLNWFCSKQVMIIWGLYVVYDYMFHQDWLHTVGYIVLLVPLKFFLYDIKDFQSKMDSKLNRQESMVLLLGATLMLFLYNSSDSVTNYNMLIISVGSMLTLLISQFDKYQNYTSFFNKCLFIKNYKVNIVIIDIVYLLVNYISMHTINYFDIAFNLVVILMIVPSGNDCFDFQQVQVTETDDEKPMGLLLQIFTSRETKSISMFLLLNTSFMFVQLLYSFRSKSLSLLSDSLHMLLDCTSLFLGLLANLISSKQSDKFPFGLYKVENLAGFTNGCLLISIVGSILIESLSRIFKPVDLQKTTELLIVSFLGLVVNLVGIFLFNHGHEHGGHSHSHSHDEDKHSHNHQHQHSHTHDDSKLNDNMHGIFLHILADTLGSVGVIISTIFIKIFNLQILDPLTSLFIGALIFMSSIPLLKSSVKNLLLSLDPKKTLFLKNQFFQDLLLIQGLKTYSTPRFWPTKDGKLTGYIHIIFFKNCPSTTKLRENVNLLLKQHDLQFDKIYIQYENEIDDCWCRNSQNHIG